MPDAEEARRKTLRGYRDFVSDLTFLDKEVYYGEDNVFLKTEDGFHYKTKNVIYANEKKTIYNLLADNKPVYDENSSSKIEVYGENIKSDIFYYGFIIPKNEKAQI